jgi:hypothetical protein
MGASHEVVWSLSSFELAGFDLTGEEFHLISRLVYEKFGINLGEQKRMLVIERLQKELRETSGCPSARRRSVVGRRA